MKHFLSLILALSIFIATGICSAQVASGPSIALPPAEVIMNMCKQMGIEVVDGDYVVSRMPDLINKTGKVFVIDARPARTYDDGFVPTAFNMFDARFKLIYPRMNEEGLSLSLFSISLTKHAFLSAISKGCQGFYCHLQFPQKGLPIK